MAGQRMEATAPAILSFHAPSHVLEALQGMWRTEDLAFSPDFRRIAITAFYWNRIYVFELDKDERQSSGSLNLTACLEISSEALREPHGVAFLDEDRIVVANRGGAATIFWLPPVGYVENRLELDPVKTLRGRWRHRIATPGSVAARGFGDGRFEVLVCNNYQDTVTRHVLDANHSYRAREDRVLLRGGLSVPDGVSMSTDGRWIAISNHSSDSVLIFENTSDLGPQTAPVAELLDVKCPHALQFTDDGRWLLVASAASPYVLVYACDNAASDGAAAGTWRGARQPAASLRIMDDETFFKGRYNPEEGGPKGLALSGELNLLAVTSEHQPLAFFELEAVLGLVQQAG